MVMSKIFTGGERRNTWTSVKYLMYIRYFILTAAFGLRMGEFKLGELCSSRQVAQLVSGSGKDPNLMAELLLFSSFRNRVIY